MRNLSTFFKYINYRIGANTKYAVHSPFVFAFVTEILENHKGAFYAYDKIEPLRKQLLRDKRLLEVEDQGAGSTVFKTGTRRVCDIARYSVMRRKYAWLLHRIVASFKPETLIELGTSLGVTSLYLAAGNPRGTVYTLEGSKAIRHIALENFEAQHVKNIQSIAGDFDTELPPLLDTIGRLDFVLLDGNHRKEATLRYFEWCMAKSHNDTILVFDDIHWSAEMEEAWEIICKDPRVRTSIDLFQLGIVFLKQELHPAHFVLRF